MQAHKRNPSQRLELWGWRHGPKGKLTIYDFDLPRRKGKLNFMGRDAEEWWVFSQVCNVPFDESMPFRTEVVDSLGNIITGATPRDNVDRVRPGYFDVLVTLLRDGCIKPGRVLDMWLGLDSRQLCDNWLRIAYVR